MAIVNPGRKVDGQISFEGGVDTGVSPDRVRPNQLALLVNGSCRNDLIAQRPGLRQCPLTFSSRPNEDVATLFQTGYFQGHHPLAVPRSDPSLIASISGRLFRVSLPDFVVTCIWPASYDIVNAVWRDENPTILPQAWFEQVESQLAWQDSQSIPLIISTGSVRRSDVNGVNGTIVSGTTTFPKRELPIGRAMGYANGRLTVSLPDQASFVIGDIVGGPTGPLFFTENQFLNEGGAFKVPSNLGPIESVRAVAILDTSLGQGATQVLTDDGIFSCNPPADRTTWKDVQYPINTVAVMGQGTRSDYSVVRANSDIWYRADDGIRSEAIARRDFGMWSNVAQSHEVEAHLANDSQPLLDRASGVVFENWLIQTCQPQLDQDRGVYHLGAVVLDFVPLTSIGAQTQPVWEGMWTGRKFMQFSSVKVRGQTRCFVFCLSDARNLELWELDSSLTHDELADGTRLRIVTAIEFARLSFSNKMELKALDAFDGWFAEQRGVIDVNLFYRPDQGHCWYPWQSWQECAKDETCAADMTGPCPTPLDLRPGYHPRVSAQQPTDFCNSTGFPTTIGYQFQARLDYTGSMQVLGYRLVAHQVSEDKYGQCPPIEVTPCPQNVCCGPDNVINSVA